MKRTLARMFRQVENFALTRMNHPMWRSFSIGLTLLELHREAKAVAWGRSFSRTGDARAELTTLRRAVHRLEKGMIMRPRRLPFGKEYLSSSVQSLKHLIEIDGIPESDLSWSTDVLSSYFILMEAVETDWIGNARHDFEAFTAVEPSPSLVPFTRDEAPQLSVSIDQLEALAIRRRSVRWFEDKPVNAAEVDRALMLAGQAPSACNRQNIRFHLVYGQAESAQVLNTVGGTRGFSHQVPAVAVLIGREAGYRHSFDRHAIFVDGGLASMGFLFALEAMGMSSCCINWPDVGQQYSNIKKLIHIEPDEQIIMMIAIGHADTSGLIPSSQKRGLETFRTRS